jgi:hypothetical protein
MIARLRLQLSAGDLVAGVPAFAYVAAGLTWTTIRDGLVLGTIFIVVALAIGAVSYGTLLVALDDLVSWRRSPELKRWLLRMGAMVLGCLLFLGDMTETWRWISD